MRRSVCLAIVACAGLAASAQAIVITHNSTNNIANGNPTCRYNADQRHADNEWGRTFNLPTFGIPGNFQVTSIQFAVFHSAALAPATTQPVTVHIYDGYTVAAGVVTPGPQVNAVTVQVANGDAFLVTVPITGTITSGFLFATVSDPDQPIGPGDQFFLGHNLDAQDDTAYLKSVACGLPTFLDYAAIGLANNSLVLNVNGIVPAPGAAALLGLSGLFAARRRR